MSDTNRKGLKSGSAPFGVLMKTEGVKGKIVKMAQHRGEKK